MWGETRAAELVMAMALSKDCLRAAVKEIELDCLKAEAKWEEK